MDSEVAAEFGKIADQLDGYSFGDAKPPISEDSWRSNGYLGFGTSITLRTAPDDGPNVVLVGGQHGFEKAGYKAVEEIMGRDHNCGSIKYIPRADPTAIEAQTYSGDGGNMNRQWGTGGSPSTPQVANLLNEIESHDPDFVFDLHSSKGIYSVGPASEGVGQAIFPTPGVHDMAKSVNRRINQKFGWGSSNEMRFTRGNKQTGSNNKLSHKVGGDLDGAECFLIETSRMGSNLAQRIVWTVAAVEITLEELGIRLD